ncbi:MAG: VCBS repeat-containing protein [Saprospiraceae bacterium]|nr:VCBS repeat-containing protein [Saprospiraceae bacterium]
MKTNFLRLAALAVMASLLFCLPLRAQLFSSVRLNQFEINLEKALMHDYDGDGDNDIIVVAWLPRQIWLLENDGTQHFTPSVLIDQNVPLPSDFELGDFNNDGLTDYLVSSIVNNGEIAWFQRLPGGGFTKWTVDVNDNFDEIEVADFNGDGFDDIASVGVLSSTTKIYLNNQDFFFTEVTLESAGNSNTTISGLGIGDIDGDGDVDIAYGASTFISGKVLWNDGNGIFSIGPLFSAGFPVQDGSAGYRDIAIADMNLDGTKDIVTYGNISLGGSGLAIYSGANDFFLLQTIETPMASLYADTEIWDFDGNGLPDIARYNSTFNSIVIFYQTQLGQYSPAVLDRSMQAGGTGFITGDLDNDGDMDLISTENNEVAWFENTGGTFLYRHNILGGLDDPRTVKFADVDNDGDLDIAVTTTGTYEDEVLLYQNLGNGQFTNWMLKDFVDYPADLDFADIDQDGDLDLFGSARDGDYVYWLRNDGFYGKWAIDTIDAVLNNPLGIGKGDFDNDGKIDLAVCSNNEQKVFWYKNLGGGDFQKKIVDPFVGLPREIEAGDFNNDGSPDLVLASVDTAYSLSVYTNNGSGAFTRQILLSGRTCMDVQVVDWNVDGTPDILAAFEKIGSSSANVMAFVSNGAGGFTQTTLVTGNSDVNAVHAADFNFDGAPDFVYAPEFFNGDLNIVLNDNGQSGTSYPLTTQTGEVYSIDIGDVNNDGQLDVVHANFAKNFIELTTLECLFPVDITVEIQPASCGSATGSAAVTQVSGLAPFTYHWSNGQTASTATMLAPGSYQLTVTDARGCQKVRVVNIVSASTAALAVSTVNATCGQSNGSATVSSTNNIGIASVLWSNGATTATINGLPAGSYEATVTDVNGCTSTKIATLAATPVIAFVLNGENTDCDQQNGQVSANITNGISANSYLWSNGAMTTSISGLSGGTYSLTITDVNGCTASQSTSIESLVSPQIDLGPDVEINTGQSATLDAGSGPGWMYQWSNGATSQSITVSTASTYGVTVTNGQGCTASDAVTVTLMTAVGERLPQGAFWLYPNPATDMVYLENNEVERRAWLLMVVNAVGQQVLLQSFEKNEKIAFNVNDWPSGLYIIQLETDDGFWSSPFVKM